MVLGLRCLFILIFILHLSGCRTIDKHENENWSQPGGDNSNHYSDLDQINKTNVGQLKVAWVYHTGDTAKGRQGEIQCNPIIIDGVLYATSPRLQLFALNAATGELLWKFNPFDSIRTAHVSRGVVYWRKGDDERILFSARNKLFAINAKDGVPVSSFGDGGYIDLRSGLDRDASESYVIASSPGAVYKDLFIIGSRVSETNDAAPGHIRAFNVITGKREWIFHTIPHPGEYGYETWPEDAWKNLGGANSWSGLTVDHENGIVFVPLGSPSFDFYGGNRKGQNLFGNCLVALDANTGKRIWHYQTVHHDLWDRDLSAPPNLVTVQKDGKKIQAVAQITKQGFIFLFERKTGVPIFPIEERGVPASGLPGEHTWPTQPYPIIPKPFVRQIFDSTEITNISPEAHAEIAGKLGQLKTGNLFNPPTKEGTIILPGFDGGGEWGGASYDPETSTLFVNGSEMPWILTMIDNRIAGRTPSVGEQLYRTNCAVCHGIDKAGEQHQFPSLIAIQNRLSTAQIHTILENGKGRMPSFKNLKEKERTMIVNYLTGIGEKGKRPELQSAAQPDKELPYSFTGYHRFLDKNEYPAIRPPWGVLAAINLNTGEYTWKVPFGEYKELSAKGIPVTGTENYGGAVVTKGGLLFIGATKDEMFRAFDIDNGKIIWETKLPAGGYATPSTYSVNGKQYVVIAAGGSKMGTPPGDAYIAYALP